MVEWNVVSRWTRVDRPRLSDPLVWPLQSTISSICQMNVLQLHKYYLLLSTFASPESVHALYSLPFSKSATICDSAPSWRTTQHVGVGPLSWAGTKLKSIGCASMQGITSEQMVNVNIISLMYDNFGKVCVTKIRIIRGRESSMPCTTHLKMILQARWPWKVPPH